VDIHTRFVYIMLAALVINTTFSNLGNYTNWLSCTIHIPFNENSINWHLEVAATQNIVSCL